MTEDLAALIQRVMRERNWTLEAVARRAGMPISTVHSWATKARAAGSRGPNPSRLRQLANGLDIPLAEVFEAAGRRNPEAMNADEERSLLELLNLLRRRDREVLRATAEAMLARDRAPDA